VTDVVYQHVAYVPMRTFDRWSNLRSINTGLTLRVHSHLTYTTGNLCLMWPQRCRPLIPGRTGSSSGTSQRPKATVTRSTVQYPAADPRHTFPPRSGRRNAPSTVIPRVSYNHKSPLSRGVPPSVRPVDTSRGPWYSRASNKQSSSIVYSEEHQGDVELYCDLLLLLAVTVFVTPTAKTSADKGS
jgi:hypothetical protein